MTSTMRIQPINQPSNLSIKLPPNQNSPNLKSLSLSPYTTKLNLFKSMRISAASSSQTLKSSISDDKKKRNQGEENSIEKPRLVLKFIWMKKNIGIALDQAIPGYGTVPMSPCYFWPRKDAWEELKIMLESKPWITNKQMVVLLNQATDIINLWQQSGGDLA